MEILSNPQEDIGFYKTTLLVEIDIQTQFGVESAVQFAKFPDVEYTTKYPGGKASGLKIDPDSLHLTNKEALRSQLVDLLFNMDCEDF